MAIKVRIERVEVKYNGKFSECDTAELIRLCAALNASGDLSVNIAYEDITEYDRRIGAEVKDGDLLQVNVNNKYPCSHIAEIEWYYVEETEDEPEDDYYYEESRRFYEDDYSPETYAGWAQQDTIDMYRRER